MADPTTEPGTGGEIDDVVSKHAGILAAEDGDTREEGEATTEGDESEVESADTEVEDDAEAEAEGDESEDGEGEDEGDEEEADEDAEDEEDDDSDEDPDEEPTFKVKVDGEEVEVSQSELLAGYSRQADYTRKAMALADERKAFAQESEAVRTERQQYATLLDKLKEQVESGGEKEPDWEKLYAEDRTEWAHQRELHRARRERLEAIEAEKERVAQQEQAERQKQLQDKVAEERERLQAAIPEMADEKKAKERMEKIRAYAVEKAGFTDEALQGIYDHRAVVVLDKARRYDELEAKGSSAKKKAGKRKGGPKTLKPGNTRSGTNRTSRAAKEARQRLKSSGDAHDAAHLIADLLD